MHIHPFKANYPNLNIDPFPNNFFEKAKSAYLTYFKQGYFSKTEDPALYIYQIEKGSQQRIGIVSSVAVQDLLEGRLKPHESTIESEEEKQIRLLLHRKAAVKPVLAIYPQVEQLNHWLSLYIQQHEAFFRATLGTAAHTIWQITNPDEIAELQWLFREKVPYSYIADGHHRAFSASRMLIRSQQGIYRKTYDQLFCAFFSSDSVEILEFNRVVTGLNGLTPLGLMAKLGALFEITILNQAEKPAEKFEITACLRGEWFRLRWKEHILLEYPEETVLLDAKLLDEKVIAPILGISDVRSDQRMEYYEGPKGLEILEKRCRSKKLRIAFCLYPVLFEELAKVTDAGEIMPPKSTWFEPRMLNGLLVRPIE
ncbi:MAG TPA: DUF1015 family protein [Saprospiraceae bacterium]|nr:DUF1015 family protein [Saprospiraceae bacterium]HMQ84881.1 DUF1015 family protein [Saprospiraceae bacterium]